MTSDPRAFALLALLALAVCAWQYRHPLPAEARRWWAWRRFDRTLTRRNPR